MPEIKWHDLDRQTRPVASKGLNWIEIQTPTSLYEVLEVSPHASYEVIKAAYRALMEKCHPDKHPGPGRSSAWAEEMSRKLNHAYSILSNPQKRGEYDSQHGINRRTQL